MKAVCKGAVFCKYEGCEHYFEHEHTGYNCNRVCRTYNYHCCVKLSELRKEKLKKIESK